MKRLMTVVMLVLLGAGSVMAGSQQPLYQEPRKPPEKIKDKDKPKPDDRNKGQGSKDDKKRDDRKKPEIY